MIRSPKNEATISSGCTSITGEIAASLHSVSLLTGDIGGGYIFSIGKIREQALKDFHR